VPVGAHLSRPGAVLEGTGEEPASGRQVPLLGDQHVDDLAELIDRPVQIDAPPGDLDICFVDKPAITWNVPARPCRVDQQRDKSLYPAIDRDVIDPDAPLHQQLSTSR
jgi:hypothetical protein